jgi:pilus assembly protein CpaE
MADTQGPAASVLVVSPDAETRREAVTRFEELAGAQSVCVEAETAARALDLAAARRAATVLVDLRDDPAEMLRIVPRLLEKSPGAKIIGLYNPLRLPQGTDAAELFLEGMRRGIHDFLRLPVSPDEARRVFERLSPASSNGDAGPEHGRIVSFMSSKGGVGKTSLAVNCAAALARRFPGEIAVLDASLEAGSVADFLNLKPGKTLFDAAAARGKLDGDLLRSLMLRHEESGLWILPSPTQVEQAHAVSDDALLQVLIAARDSFRFVLVDTYPIFNAMSIAVGDLSERIAVVTEAIVPAVNGTRELFKRLKDAGYQDERLKLALNAYAHFQGNVEPALVAEAMGRAVDWVLPYDKTMHVCANLGRVYLHHSPGSALARKIDAMATELAGLSASAAWPLWKRLLRLGRAR